MTLQASASAFRALLSSFKRAIFSSINTSATDRSPVFVTVAGVCALLLLGGTVPAHATPSPSVKFSAAQSVVPTGSLSYPYRVAVDASGNVYISDTQAERILKETLANGVYTESVVIPSSFGLSHALRNRGRWQRQCVRCR